MRLLFLVLCSIFLCLPLSAGLPPAHSAVFQYQQAPSEFRRDPFSPSNRHLRQKILYTNLVSLGMGLEFVQGDDIGVGQEPVWENLTEGKVLFSYPSSYLTSLELINENNIGGCENFSKIVKVDMDKYRHFGQIVSRASNEYKIPPELIAAVIHQESKGNPFAIRFEPTFLNRYLKNKTRKDLQGYVPTACTLQTEVYARASSWGLMQIMGETAREHGLESPYLAELCDPEINIMLGTKILRHFLDRHENDTRRALLAYNGGGNLSYPSKVLSNIEGGGVAYLLF